MNRQWHTSKMGHLHLQGIPSLAAAVARASMARTRRLYLLAHKDGYKVIVVGGGSGGSAIAAHCSRKYGRGQVAVIDAAGGCSWELTSPPLRLLLCTAARVSLLLPFPCPCSTWAKVHKLLPLAVDVQAWHWQH